MKVTTGDGWSVTLSPIAPNRYGEGGYVSVWVKAPDGQRLHMLTYPENVEVSEAGAEKVLELARQFMGRM